MDKRDRILIVADEILNREFEGYLNQAGYDTQSASSGEAALAMLSPAVDLIVLDPMLTGLEVIQKVREHPQLWDVPVIMVAAPDMQAERVKAAEVGVSDFITTPVDDAELQLRIASLLKMKHAQDAIKSHQIEMDQRVNERTAELKAANERLEGLATNDTLTGLPNHLDFIAALDRELERSQRYSRSFAFLLVDLDHFKTLNDHYGHPAGDAVLAAIGDIVRPCLRGIDTIGRWGGEEFGIILPEIDHTIALDTAERVRSALTAYSFPPAQTHNAAAPDAQEMHLTCSIGVSMYPRDAGNRSDIVKAADRAMFGAKRLGRNQVRSAIDPVVSVFDQATDMREAEIVQGVVEALAALVSARDCYTGRHTLEVAEFAERIALAMGLSAQDAHLVSLVGQLHDIGKVAIPDSVLQKPSDLNGEEWAMMRQHSVVGADVVSRMPTLSTIAKAIRAHHERWDGQGYPDGLCGEDIPLAARIVSVADTFGAITSDRPYRKAQSTGWAVGELRRCAGKQFDPQVVDAAEWVVGEYYGYMEDAA